MAESKTFQFYEIRPSACDFYRCHDCRRIFTREEEVATYRRLTTGEQKKVEMCRCGSQKFKRGWPRLFEWFRPNVVRYTSKLVLARGLAPWLDRHLPMALPLVEYFVQPKEE